MRILLIWLFLCISLEAVEYKMVFKHDIYLSKNDIGTLKLYEENSKRLAQNPAKIIIEYTSNGKKYKFNFSETKNNSKYYYSSSEISKDFPIYYFKNMNFNTKVNQIVKLTNGVNVFDIDNNGNNEIFVYGTSHYGGSGSFGKVVILEKDGDKIIQKAPIIEANDNYEIKYYKNKNLIIVAQYIWRSGIEAHYGDNHLYKFYIYDIDDKFKKIPIFLSKKKFNDENQNIVEKNLEDILLKYSLYKKGKVSDKEQTRVISFVKRYWKEVSKKNLNFINKSFNSKAFYYTKVLSKKDILRDKKNALKRVKKIDFDLSDFLIYKKDNKFIVEYMKSFDIDDGTNYGRVKSILELEDTNNNFIILKEKDIAILSLKKDID